MRKALQTFQIYSRDSYRLLFTPTARLEEASFKSILEIHYLHPWVQPMTPNTFKSILEIHQLNRSSTRLRMLFQIYSRDSETLQTYAHDLQINFQIYSRDSSRP